MSDIEIPETNVDVMHHESQESENVFTFDEVESLTETKSDEEVMKDAKELTKETEAKETKEAQNPNEITSEEEQLENINEEVTEEAIEELTEMDYKKIIGSFNDQEVNVAAEAIFKHKVDGEEVDVTLQELLNNYSGKIPYDKKFNELAVSKKNYETQLNQVNEYINTFGTKIKNNDMMGALTYLAEFSGMSPLEFKAKLQESMFPKFEQMQNMTEEQKQALALQEENEYLKYKQESDAQKVSQQQSNMELEKELKGIQETHSLEDADMVRLYDELAATYEGEITPQLIGEYHVNLQAYEKTESLLSEIDPNLVSNDEEVDAVAKEMIANPEISNEEWKEILQEAYGESKKAESNSKKVSKKVRSQKQEEAVTRNVPQSENFLNFDEL